jgi:hypothetical protein
MTLATFLYAVGRVCGLLFVVVLAVSAAAVLRERLTLGYRAMSESA